MEVYGNHGPGNLVAAAHVHLEDNEGTGIPSFLGQPFGFVPTVTAGLGGDIIFTFSTHNHIAPADSVMMVSLDGTVGNLVTVEKSDEVTTRVRIATSLGGVGISDFWISVFRKG